MNSAPRVVVCVPTYNEAENLPPEQREHLRDGFVSGTELVDGTARLAAMNMLLHGIGKPDGDSLVTVGDALTADSGKRYSVVLANPPFGRKSSVTMIGKSMMVVLLLTHTLIRAAMASAFTVRCAAPSARRPTPRRSKP